MRYRHRLIDAISPPPVYPHPDPKRCLAAVRAKVEPADGLTAQHFFEPVAPRRRLIDELLQFL